jgi:exportin-2 (importin alpha re-exporter)
LVQQYQIQSQPLSLRSFRLSQRFCKEISIVRSFLVFKVAIKQTLSTAEYIPYVFQILAQMLTLHRGVPTDYRALLPFLLTPAIWAQKGSIPGLVALLRAFLARDAAVMIEANQHTSVLGIVQQRLVPSKANDGWGFELLQSVVLHIPL